MVGEFRSEPIAFMNHRAVLAHGVCQRSAFGTQQQRLWVSWLCSLTRGTRLESLRVRRALSKLSHVIFRPRHEHEVGSSAVRKQRARLIGRCEQRHDWAGD